MIHFSQQLPIDFIGQGGFRFGDMSHQGVLLTLPTGMTAIEDLSAASLEAALNAEIDIFLLGTGEKMQRINKELYASFRQKFINTDSMTTAQAVSTYNVLLDEKRRVGAAFIPV